MVGHDLFVYEMVYIGGKAFHTSIICCIAVSNLDNCYPSIKINQLKNVKYSSNQSKQSINSAIKPITSSYRIFHHLQEDLVSQELMVVVDIGLHLLLHSRPRDFFLFSFFLHQIMWVFGFDHLC